MYTKPYRLGIIVGRFQVFHAGHEFMIDKAISLCEEVGIFIGSAQESGTYKNPLTYEMRKSLIETVYGGKVRIYPLEDIGVGNNSRWGDYVLENVEKQMGVSPDLLVSGKEDRRIDWFDSVKGLTISELYVPKTVEISASAMREFMIRNDKESWMRYTDPKLWDRFEELRQIVLSSHLNQFTSSL